MITNNLEQRLNQLLKCPITQKELVFLTGDRLEAFNKRIIKGEIFQRDGTLFSTPLQQVLQAKDHDLYYPVIEEICYLLSSLALSVTGDQIIALTTDQHTKQQVKQFYENIGWQDQGGVYIDARDSEDLREVSSDYILQCHLRLKKHLPKSGTYLLDVASGPIQYPAYMTYSENFEWRVCADISLKALQEAKKKLGPKGIYLLCDVTNIPLQADKIDAVVSLHTLYHVPAQEQGKAFAELNRVLKPGGVSVVVYSWGSSALLMNVLLFPWKLIALGRKLLKKIQSPSTSNQPLYFYAHGYRWFVKEIQSNYQTKLYSWRSLNVPFLQIYIHSLFGGRSILKFIYYLEDRFHYILGRFGAYPLFVSIKK